MNLTILIVSAALLASTLAHPHHHKHRSSGEEEDEGAKHPKQAYKTRSTRLSDVQATEWIGESMGMLIYQDKYYMTPLSLKKTFTNTPAQVKAAGAIEFQGLELSSTTLLSLHFKVIHNISFTDASIRFQLEAKENEKSVIVSLHIDMAIMQKLCPERDYKLHCTRGLKEEEALLVLDGIPVPTFDDFELPQSGSGTLHLWLEDEEANVLFESRFFAKKE